jgi:hypothetical protein
MTGLPFLRLFVKNCIKFFSLNAFADEILWFDTGYWCIENDQKQFMGIGLNSLEKAVKKTKSSRFMICLANRDSVVVIQSPISEGENKLDATIVDAYSTNAYLPFAEVADIYRQGLKSTCDYKILKNEFILESSLHHGYAKKTSFTPRVVQ